MHSVKRILTTENRTCAIRPTAIQSINRMEVMKNAKFQLNISKVMTAGHKNTETWGVNKTSVK